MKSLSYKEIFFTGLVLFALFFGAGNLIFPPFLGQEAGENYWTAILGFVVTGVGLPLLGIVAIALTGSSFEKVANKVTPLFAIIFTLVLYLAIGPFFGIPRAVNVSYEMGAVPFLPALESYSTLYLFLYSLVFFLIVYWLSLNPSKLVKRIGVVITPLLLFSIVLLVIGNVMTTAGSVDLLPTDEYLYSPFSRGMIEGYLTMDTIAALAFGLLIVNMIREKGIENRKSIVKATVLAGIIAGIGLGAVYIAIGWLGVQSGAVQTFENGTQILNYTADQTFGYVGVALLGFIVTLACLTTCVGLVTASAQYLARVLPSLSYGVLVLLITIVSFAVANLGLNAIISISVPVLVAIYPLAIILIFLTLASVKIKLRQGHYVGAVVGTGIISLYDGLRAAEIEVGALDTLFGNLPFFDLNLGWILPALIGMTIGHFFGKK